MDDYNHSLRREQLIEFAIMQPAKIENPRALQHLTEGFNRRVLMIDSCIRRIHQQADETGGQPLSPLIVPEFAVFVNSFWLNVCGALDNVAWAVNYELGLFPTAREDGGNKRRDIVLFGTAYRRALAVKDPVLAIKLEPFRAWHQDLATLRDPGAHRIPIYPVPGVMNGAAGAEAKRLYEEGDALIRAGDHNAGMERIHAGYNLGTYEPWIALSHNGRVEFRDLLTEVRRDEEAFVEVSEAILETLFR